MLISKKEDLNLKLGNLLLSAILSAVPTAMTIGFLSVHGTIVCNDLESRLNNPKTELISETCYISNLESSYKYILWIWLFITITTWRWFYIGHARRVRSNRGKN